MAFTVRNAGDTIRSADIREIQDALQGVSGGGVRMQFTQVDDSTNYVVHIKPQDTTNGRALLVEKQDGTDVLALAQTTAAFWTDDLYIIEGGKVCINDTANGDMTVGLTLNQGANDNEILALKSSDVAHGVTSSTETDTYGRMKKYAANGGLVIDGFKQTGSVGLALAGVAPTDDTTKSIAGVGYVVLQPSKINGTGIQDAGANANLVVITNNATTRFIFDAEGSGHADVEWVAFDDSDDVALLNKMDAAMTRDPVKTAFGAYLSDYRDELQKHRIVNFYDDGPRAMVNFTRLAMLLTGAVRQLGRRNEELRSEMAELLLLTEAVRQLGRRNEELRSEMAELRRLLPAAA